MALKNINDALTYDDVLLVPNYSEITPPQACVKTFLARGLEIGIPIISAPMDTVTEANMAIAMALVGGIGIVHKNMLPEKLAAEIRTVKQFSNFIRNNPAVIGENATVAEAKDLMLEHDCSGIPVISEEGKLLGIITHRDIRFLESQLLGIDQLVKDVVNHNRHVVSALEGVSCEEALNLMHENRIERLPIVDLDNRCTGLITMSDIQRVNSLQDLEIPRDKSGRLLVGVAVGATNLEILPMIMKEEPDVVVVDTAHGHSKKVIEAVLHIKSNFPDAKIIAGNVATFEGAKALIEAGADAVKVGIGPGSICTTRIVTGVGVPQLTAIMEARRACEGTNVTVIADGGIKYSGDISKAIAAGADSVMIGSLLASTDESPGETLVSGGKRYKTYRGMGSIGAMKKGSSDRYQQAGVTCTTKFVPEGVEGMVPLKGKVSEVVYSLVGGLKAAMGYTGNSTIKLLQENSTMVRITNAGLRESHVHDITMTREAPNYSGKIEG